jgi:heme exporter protein D
MGATAHISYIAAAYSAAVIIVGGLIVWVMLDYRAQRRTLTDLEMRGITRRSEPARSAPAMQQAKEEA